MGAKGLMGEAGVTSSAIHRRLCSPLTICVNSLSAFARLTMESSDSDISDTECFFSPTEIKPYQFEPRYTEGEVSDSSDDQDESDDSVGSDSTEDSSRQTNSDWCHCENCIAMPLLSECVCCLENDAIEQKLEGETCITSGTTIFNLFA
ncbi:uncharacterized protein [Ptychodera flava]|uniref:uncharacterized protein n=1 Tax=Ptychodera flava TaxID=63121 RepID=UPI00396A73B2